MKGTEVGIGDGKRNAELLVAVLNNMGENGAALFCDDFEINGYDDWFLPSKAELNLMYMRLKEKNLGGFKDQNYWSSSYIKPFGADVWVWHQNFSNGSQSEGLSGSVLMVRAVRAF